MIFSKVWGTTSPILFKNNVEIHRIKIEEGGYCSKHLHKYKYNMFFVESGKLLIETWKSDSGLIDSTILITGDQTIVKPNEIHRFSALAPTIAYEIYWIELDPNDIQREDHGGLR